MPSGKLIIFSAPSGSGKTTLVHHLLDTLPELSFSISATSRAIRGKEEHQKDYYFLSAEDFKNKIDNNEFLEYEEVYEGTYYGTLRSEVERIWAEGKHVVFDIDVQGGLNLKKEFGDSALAVFVQPPSVEELKRRLQGRGTEDDASLAKRVAKAEEELSFANLFDAIILNDELEKAKNEAHQLVSQFIG